MKQGEWPPERTALLRELWTAGHSYSHIAATLGEGLTRNAIIGKVYRLGLPLRDPATQQISSGQYRRLLKRKKKAPPPVPPPAARRPPPAGNPPQCDPVAFLELEQHHCRWPHGTGPYTFCGAAKVPGLSYCSYHQGLAFLPLPVRVRDRYPSNAPRHVIIAAKEPVS